MKLLFFGTPAEAAPFLEACAKDYEVLAVVTRPDRPSGRGLAVSPSQVKAAALRLGLKVLEPEKPSLIAAQLRDLAADMAVVVAYGKILKPDVLSSTRLGFMNVHFSLLPKCRGAAPIEWSLIRGETRTGVTLFWINEGMDTGPVQSSRETGIGPDEDALGLAGRLIELGVLALGDALRDISAGRVRREPQTGEPSLAPKLTRQDARIDFDRPAVETHNRVRGLRGGPRAYFQRGKESVTVLKTIVGPDSGPSTVPTAPVPSGDLRPGTLVRVERERGILVQCHSGRLWLVEVQPEGKRQIPAADFINGLRLKPGELLA